MTWGHLPARALLALALLLWLVAPAAGSVPFKAEVDSQAQTNFSGGMNGTMELSGWKAQSNGVVVESFFQGRIRLFQQTVLELQAPRSSPGGQESQERVIREETLKDLQYNGPMRVSEASNATLVVLPPAPDRALFASGASKGFHGLAVGDAIRSYPGLRPTVDGRVLQPALPAMIQDPFNIELPNQDLVLLLHGGNVALGEASFFAGDQYVAQLPSEYASTTIVNRTFLVATGSASLTMPAEAAAEIYVRRQTVELHGELLLTDVATKAETSSQFIDRQSATFRVNGIYNGTMEMRDGTAHWSLQGMADGIAVDGAQLLPAGTATIGALALVVPLVWWQIGRIAATLLKSRAKPLENANRVRLLAEVRNNPGITKPELARILGLGRATIQFHVSVLQRASLVQARRQGLVEHLYDDRVTAVPRPELNHPVRDAIIAILQERDQGTYASLSPFLTQRLGMPVSRSLFNYHATALQKAHSLERSGKSSSVWRLSQKANPSVLEAREASTASATV